MRAGSGCLPTENDGDLLKREDEDLPVNEDGVALNSSYLSMMRVELLGKDLYGIGSKHD